MTVAAVARGLRSTALAVDRSTDTSWILRENHAHLDTLTSEGSFGKNGTGDVRSMLGMRGVYRND